MALPQGNRVFQLEPLKLDIWPWETETRSLGHTAVSVSLFNWEQRCIFVNLSNFIHVHFSVWKTILSIAGFNSLVGAIMGFSILISAEVFKHHPDVWFLDGTMGVLIGLIILAYGVKYEINQQFYELIWNISSFLCIFYHDQILISASYTHHICLSPQTAEGHGAPCEADEKLRTFWMRPVCVDQMNRFTHTLTHSHSPGCLLPSVFHKHTSLTYTDIRNTYTYGAPVLKHIWCIYCI